jgi:hypothetical protein
MLKALSPAMFDTVEGIFTQHPYSSLTKQQYGNTCDANDAQAKAQAPVSVVEDTCCQSPSAVQPYSAVSCHSVHVTSLAGVHMPHATGHADCASVE